ncbi:MAG: universal stress protein [Chloroflexi bacterium]|nr:universal stress protein [Chloroflexota bacterium]
MYGKILVAFDGSEGSWRALRAAIGLARDQSAELWALSVEEHLPHYAAAIGEFEEARAEKNEYFRKLHGQAIELAESDGVRLQSAVLPGHAVQTIVRFASQGGFDLIVMGHSGYSGVWGAFLGTTTDKVSRHAPCSVLIVR